MIDVKECYICPMKCIDTNELEKKSSNKKNKTKQKNQTFPFIFFNQGKPVMETTVLNVTVKQMLHKGYIVRIFSL